MTVTPISLGEVATFIRGITFKPEDKVEIDSPDAVVCMRTKNVQDIIDQDDLIAIPPTFVNRQEQYLSEGDILVSTANSWELVGKSCWVPKIDYKATAGGFISILRANREKVFPRYLYHWMNSAETLRNLRYCGRQTTNISNMSFELACGLKLPLPPLPEQKRIAATLDKADSIRRKRQEAVRLTEELLRSVFLDMFGDPVTNPKGWEVVKFENVGSLDRGVSKHRPRNAPQLLGGPYPLIQTGEVANSDGYIRSYKNTYSEVGLKQSKMWPATTLCITIAANIAKTGILTFDSCFPDSVVGFTPNSHATTEYVQYWLSFLQKILEDTAPESAQKNINLEILRNLDIPLPPIELQTQFTKQVIKMHELKAKQSAGIENTNFLFSSLLQRAFKGNMQLDISYKNDK